MRRFPGLVEVVFASVTAGGGAAACGKVDTFTDAAPGVDGARADAGVQPGDVTVTTHSRCCSGASGALVSGVPVFAIGPTGAVDDSGSTGADGTVTLTGVEPGAGVTAIYTVDGGYDVVTVLGVQPGDALELGESFTAPAGGVDGTMTVTWPDYPGAYYYQVDTPCGSTGAYAPALSTPVAQYAYCQTPTAVITVSAFDSAWSLVGTAIVRNAAFTSGTTVDLTTWAATQPFHVEATGLAPTTSQVLVGARTVIAGSTAWLGGNSWPVIQNGTAAYDLTLASGGDAIEAMATTYRVGQLGSHYAVRAEAPTATTASIPADGLPWLGQSLINPGAHQAVWIQDGLTGYDGAVGTVMWQRTVAAPVSYTWTVLLPPGQMAWTWGAVPAQLADVLPGDTDAVSGGVMLVDLADVDGYDALRATPEWVSTYPEADVVAGNRAWATMAYSVDGGEGLAMPRRR